MRPTAICGGGAIVLEWYAEHLGIPVHDPAVGDYPWWDGTALKRPGKAEDWAHEIAHWLLATPERRLLVDYGWGHDADFEGYDRDDPEPYSYGPRPDLDRLPWPDPAVDWPDTQEEILACVLGFAFLVRVGECTQYDEYGFYGYSRDRDAAGRFIDEKRIEPSTYADRRAVQPHVAAFDTWRRATL